MDPKGKQPALNEDPSSAAGLDWRSAFPPSARVLNRVILVQALYFTYDDSNATMAHKTARFVENAIYGMAIDEHDYLMRMSQFIQVMPRTAESVQGQGNLNIPDSLNEACNGDMTPLRRLHLRHRQLDFRFYNLGSLFATKISFEQNKQRNQGVSVRQLCLHYALSTFKREAYRELSNALDHLQIELGMRAASGQMINSLEEWYAAEIEGHIQNFIYATSYNLDTLNTDQLQKYMQWLFNTDHGQFSGFLEDAKNHYRANIPEDYLAALVDSTLNLQQQPPQPQLQQLQSVAPVGSALNTQQQPLAGLPSDGNPVISPQPQLQQLQSVAPVGSALNTQQQPLAGLPSDGNPVISPQPQLQQLQSVAPVGSALNTQQQPLAGLPSDGNPVISPQPQLQQLQSVAQVDLTSHMEQMNKFIAFCSQKMLYDENAVNTEDLFDESTSEAFQNYMQELQQPPLEVEQQPPAGNLPDGEAIPPPEQQPQ